MRGSSPTAHPAPSLSTAGAVPPGPSCPGSGRAPPSGDSCVEVPTCTSTTIHVRDSKLDESPQLALTPASCTHFLSYAVRGWPPGQLRNRHALRGRARAPGGHGMGRERSVRRCSATLGTQARSRAPAGPPGVDGVSALGRVQ
ncbi:DUF397 domain-containing protein [Streptomyces rubiginosohelvolus]